MSLNKILRALDYARYGAKLHFNRLLGHEFIVPDSFFSLETSGACNLSCRFCGYGKKELSRAVMPTATFARLLDEAIELGYRDFGLTPMTGDIFMDKDIGHKLDVLERHPGVRSYWFYTNFILATPDHIRQLTTSKKLGPTLYISLYGHDAQSFTHITQRPQIQFRRLVENLNTLADIHGPDSCPVDIGIRTYPSFEWEPKPGDESEENPLLRAINRVAARKNFHYSGNILEYSDWGGVISQEEVDDIGITIVTKPKTPKVGACALIFDRQTVLADGVVNACHCHGVDGSLVIGDTRKTPLREILSARNPAFVKLIERQQAGDFPRACQSCKFYRSIYRKPHGVDTVRMGPYMDMISRR